MEFHDQLTMAQAMGEIKGLVAGVTQAFMAHDTKDDQRFEDLNEKMDAHLKLHSDEMERTLIRERELARWKWSTIWAVGGTVIGGVVVTIVTALLKVATS